MNVRVSYEVAVPVDKPAPFDMQSFQYNIKIENEVKEEALGRSVELMGEAALESVKDKLGGDVEVTQEEVAKGLERLYKETDK